MRQPVSELDTRFSDPDAVATDWEETRRALEDAELFWISTVRADGRPHVTPLAVISLHPNGEMWLRSACWTRHVGLDPGQLRTGDE